MKLDRRPSLFRTLWKRGVLVAMTLGALALNPLVTQAKDQVPFRAEWRSDLEIRVDFPIATVIGNGAGGATHLGRMTANSVAETVNLVTGAGFAEYRFVAANGDEIFLNFAFTAIPVSATEYVISGSWQFTGGSGRFSGASGSGLYGGMVAFTGPDTAEGHFAMGGTLSSPGSLK
jgi:hypothetical protein